jgi:hypothetical protein
MAVTRQRASPGERLFSSPPAQGEVCAAEHLLCYDDAPST